MLQIFGLEGQSLSWLLDATFIAQKQPQKLDGQMGVAVSHKTVFVDTEM